MRPKLGVLIVDTDADRLGRMALLLEVWGYRVERAENAAEAVEIVCRVAVRSMVVEADLLGAENLIDAAKQAQPEIGTMLLAYGATEWAENNAHVFLPRAACLPREIIERLRILAYRKRGPKNVAVKQIAVNPRDGRKIA